MSCGDACSSVRRCSVQAERKSADRVFGTNADRPLPAKPSRSRGGRGAPIKAVQTSGTVSPRAVVHGQAKLVEMRRADPPVDAARLRRTEAQANAVRRHTEVRYGARSWGCQRRVAARIEATPQGLDIRYVVTNLTGGEEWLYETLYRARGQMENLIKLHNTQLASDRTSCRSPLANQVRLLLHTGAYWLMLKVRDAIPKTAAARRRRVQDPADAPDQDCCADQRNREPRPHRLRRRMPRTPIRSQAWFAASNLPDRDLWGLCPRNRHAPKTPAPTTSVLNSC
jgi:hypothetical protein